MQMRVFINLLQGFAKRGRFWGEPHSDRFYRVYAFSYASCPIAVFE